MDPHADGVFFGLMLAFIAHIVLWFHSLYDLRFYSVEMRSEY